MNRGPAGVCNGIGTNNVTIERIDTDTQRKVIADLNAAVSSRASNLADFKQELDSAAEVKEFVKKCGQENVSEVSLA